MLFFILPSASQFCKDTKLAKKSFTHNFSKPTPPLPYQGGSFPPLIRGGWEDFEYKKISVIFIFSITKKEALSLFSYLFSITLIHNSFNIFGSTSLGASIIKSRYFWFFGNAITSRIFSVFWNSITILSSPNANHPWGGTQYSKHFSKCPNLSWICFSVSHNIANIACWSSLSCILILHHHASHPFIIKS